MSDKYEDVPCDIYTYRGRSRSMRRVMTEADLASGRSARSSVHSTKSTGRDRSCPLITYRKVVWVIPYEINQEKAKMFLTPSDFDKSWHTYWDYCEFKIYVKF